jgi:hypothetical protein
MQKVNKKTGEVTYYRLLMGKVIIHPNLLGVIPLMPGPILKHDGESKNDYERSAAKHFLAQLKQDYPDLTLTITEDALSPNAPHIRELEKHGFHYILGRADCVGAASTGIVRSLDLDTLHDHFSPGHPTNRFALQADIVQRLLQ